MARVIRIHEHGNADVLRFEELSLPPPRHGEITLHVDAIGLNRSEVMFRNGLHVENARFPARLGYEAAGVVAGFGEGVEGFSVGDAVCLVPPPSVTRWGTYADTVTVPAEFVVKRPASLSATEAAATWMAAITAYGALVDLGELAAGEVVLVLAASSSVGLACLQIARIIGAIVIATTRTRDKAETLFGLGFDHVIVTAEEDLQARVMEITSGLGVRLALDPIGGPTLADVVGAMASQGTVISYGAVDERPSEVPVLALIGKRLTLRGYTFKEIVSDPRRRLRAITFVQDGIDSGAIRPVIARTFPFEQMGDAQRYLESNAQIGKVVVTV